MSAKKASGERLTLWTIYLLLSGSAYRASIRASAAFDALIGIDHELAIAFGNGLHRAFGRAGAAADAVVGNFVCQGISPPSVN